MANYELLYKIPGEDVTEIKISPGIMLLIHARQGGFVPLQVGNTASKLSKADRPPPTSYLALCPSFVQILSIEDGTVLKSFNHLLTRSKKVDFIEQFNEKLLVKQEGENLHIVDVHTHEVTHVSKTEFLTPSAFIFLYENNLFLTFRQRQVTVWNFKGEQVTSFEDHTLWHPDTNTNNIFITAAQDYIISYCKPKEQITAASSLSNPDATRGENAVRSVLDSQGRGTVHISHILSGKCIARLAAACGGPSSSLTNGGGVDSRTVNIADLIVAQQTNANANNANANEQAVGGGPLAPLGLLEGMQRSNYDGLGDVTALHFSEERNTLYVGSRQGILHVWAQ